ncbi:MAG: low molecular weight protein arginine phosphatase [Peptococcaceae bacterium]|nr:low molecular weight protein arginine phosphatase [Peptococcaceae bacterium]
MKILFVCTGNTCRSPMSAALANRAFGEKYAVLSAGIDACGGEPASPQAIQVMQKRGIDLSGHKSRRLTLPMLAEADVVVTMTTGQQELVLRLAPEFRGKVFLLGQLAGAGDAANVADPWGGCVTSYEECAAEIEGFVDKMRARFGIADIGSSDELGTSE